MLCDELVGWLNGFNQYKAGKGNDRQIYLSCWSGNSFKVDRKSDNARQPKTVVDPFVSILGGIQPDMIDQLSDTKGRDDGFIHRFLFSMPAADPVPLLTEEDIHPSELIVWEKIVRSLYALNWDDDPQTQEPIVGKSVDLYFTDEAHRIFWDWHNEKHILEPKREDFPSSLQGAWSKFKAYCVRLALIIHLIRLRCPGVINDQGEEVRPWLDPSESEFSVTASSVLAAIQATEYFKQHTREAYRRFGFDLYDNRITDFLRLAKSRGGRLPLRDAQRERRFGKGISDVEKFVRIVMDRVGGNLSIYKAKNGRDCKVYLLPPSTPEPSLEETA